MTRKSTSAPRSHELHCVQVDWIPGTGRVLSLQHQHRTSCNVIWGRAARFAAKDTQHREWWEPECLRSDHPLFMAEKQLPAGSHACKLDPGRAGMGGWRLSHQSTLAELMAYAIAGNINILADIFPVDAPTPQTPTPTACLARKMGVGAPVAPAEADSFQELFLSKSSAVSGGWGGGGLEHQLSSCIFGSRGSLRHRQLLYPIGPALSPHRPPRKGSVLHSFQVKAQAD